MESIVGRFSDFFFHGRDHNREVMLITSSNSAHEVVTVKAESEDLFMKCRIQGVNFILFISNGPWPIVFEK